MISESQRERFALGTYGSLVMIRESWGGALTLCCGDVNLSAGVPAAVCVAGGTCLTIGAQSGWVKSAQNEGSMDFVVTNLSEALRTLKNNVREHRPLSVGLIADAESVAKEIMERGVLPDAIIPGEKPSAAEDILSPLIEQGAELLNLDYDGSSKALEQWLAGKNWIETIAPDAGAPELKGWNERLLEVIPEGDEVRRRWVRKAPLYLRSLRRGIRVLWLTEEERSAVGSSRG